MIIAKRLTASISNSPNQYKGYYVPVFKIFCDGTPYHAGTAFGIEHKGTRYMVTAAHVLEKDKNNPCDSKNELFVIVNNVLTQIKKYEATLINTTDPCQRKPITLDLVLIVPSEFSLSAVFSGFFKKNDWYHAQIHDQLYVVACGLPSSKNHAKNPTKELSQRPTGYFGRISPAFKCQKSGFDNRTHFCFDFLLKKTFTSTQREVKAPKPHGISGGPVLITHDFRKPTRLIKPKLRGVVIENASKWQCIVCVDLFTVLFP